MSRCTRHTSSALQTLGRLALAFSMMSSALSCSAEASTKMWQMPVPVWMQGTLAFFYTGADESGPAARNEQIHIAHRRHQALAEAWVVSSIRQTAVSGRPFARRPSRRAVTMALALRHASLPHRRMQALPLLMARAAASLVTLGRLS